MVANKLNIAINNMIDNSVDKYDDLILAAIEAGETLDKEKLQALWTQACGDAPKTTKAKKVKDPNAPKAPLSSFMRYSQEKREGVKKDNPEMTAQQVVSEIGRMWKALGEKGQAPYKKAYEKEKEKYVKLKEKYEAEGPHEIPDKKDPAKKDPAVKKKVPGEGCTWKMIRGERKGQDCGNTPVEGGQYCKTHAQAVSKKQTKSPVKPKAQPKPKVEPNVIRIVKHPKLSKPWHEETGFVFEKIGKSHIVCGKVVKGEILDLTDNDFETCEKYGFEYHKEEEAEEEEEEEEAEEEEEEEEEE